jgi:hypothetical protein
MTGLAETDFWDVHPQGIGALLLVGLALFPRVTLLVLLLFDGMHFALLHWIGWLIAPHLLVAVIATDLYWHTNPVLCVIAWCFAFGGTGSEASAVRRRWKTKRRDDDDDP